MSRSCVVGVNTVSLCVTWILFISMLSRNGALVCSRSVCMGSVPMIVVLVVWVSVLVVELGMVLSSCASWKRRCFGCVASRGACVIALS